MKEVYTVWAEWDIGINDHIFATYELALKNLDATLKEHVGMSYEEATARGLAGIDCNDVIGE